MHDVVGPRWGNVARERKAVAIWKTLECHGGACIGSRAWIDVGCGSGGVAASLAQRVSQVTGVDPEPWPVWASLQEKHANLVLRTSAFDCDEIPVTPGSFGVAVCNQVYEHVDKPQALLRNLHHALSPGGICYFAGPNLLWPIEPHVFWPFVHWLPRRVAVATMRMLGSSSAAQLDAWSTDYWTLIRWFRHCRFEVHGALRERLAAELDGRGYSLASAAVLRIPRVLFDILMPFSPGFVFVLRKSGEAASGSH